MSEHALILNRNFAVALSTAGSAAAGLRSLRRRYHLSTRSPARLVFPYFTDIRLALFLFAAADALPLSFLPLYTRAAENPWGWLDQGVVMSLPLAGYLLAILMVSPLARPLTERLGHRNLLVLAMAPTLLGDLGLYAAASTTEIVLFRSLTGLGYAIVALACQDYVLDMVPKRDRDRSLGMFSAVLFGGIFCGTAMGGVLADRLGQAAVFLISALLITISALLILRLMSGVERASQPGQLSPAIPPILAPLANRSFATLVVGIAIPANVILQAFISYLVPIVLDSLGASVADIGRTLMLYFLMIALVGPLAVRATEGRVPVAYVAAAGAALSFAALALPVVSMNQLTILVAVVLAGVGYGMLRGPLVSLAMAIAEDELVELGTTSVLSSLRTLERGGSILGLLAIAIVTTVFGYVPAIATLSLWALVGTVLFLLVPDHVRSTPR